MNGVQGQTVNLVCPPGQVISLAEGNTTAPRAVYICAGDTSCDPFYQPTGQTSNFFNTQNTSDVSSQVSAECSGKNTCSWSIPTNIVTGTCSSCSGQIQLIGTYDCVPA
jgi:hypothetical protein